MAYPLNAATMRRQKMSKEVMSKYQALVVVTTLSNLLANDPEFDEVIKPVLVDLFDYVMESGNE